MNEKNKGRRPYGQSTNDLKSKTGYIYNYSKIMQKNRRTA